MSLHLTRIEAKALDIDRKLLVQKSGNLLLLGLPQSGLEEDGWEELLSLPSGWCFYDKGGDGKDIVKIADMNIGMAILDNVEAFVHQNEILLIVPEGTNRPRNDAIQTWKYNILRTGELYDTGESYQPPRLNFTRVEARALDINKRLLLNTTSIEILGLKRDESQNGWESLATINKGWFYFDKGLEGSFKITEIDGVNPNILKYTEAIAMSGEIHEVIADGGIDKPDMPFNKVWTIKTRATGEKWITNRQGIPRVIPFRIPA